MPRLTTTNYIKISAISISVFAVVSAAVFGCCFAIYLIGSLPCGNDIINEVYSPDYQYKVVLFHSGCGVNSRDFLNAAILKADQNLSNSKFDFSRANIFTSDIRDVRELQVTWKDARSIEITYSYTAMILEPQRQFDFSNQVFTVYYREK
ncbi:MAG TPA: hypothetical protein VHM28_04750 [Anaerolineales bacterium]|nr:hypothetical protein [Anaerolineales bacterium]